MYMQLCYALLRDDKPILEIYSEIPVEIPLLPKLNPTWLHRHIATALQRSFQSSTVVSKVDERPYYPAAFGVSRHRY
jgi:hypothetical protein